MHDQAKPLLTCLLCFSLWRLQRLLKKTGTKLRCGSGQASALGWLVRSWCPPGTSALPFISFTMLAGQEELASVLADWLPLLPELFSVLKAWGGQKKAEISQADMERTGPRAQVTLVASRPSIGLACLEGACVISCIQSPVAPLILPAVFSVRKALPTLQAQAWCQAAVKSLCASLSRWACTYIHQRGHFWANANHCHDLSWAFVGKPLLLWCHSGKKKSEKNKEFLYCLSELHFSTIKKLRARISHSVL